MGSRGRSIRLRINLLVTVPLVALIGLVAYVATTTASNAINLARVPSLINATSKPTADFIRLLQAERLAAVAFAFDPAAPGAESTFTSAIQQTKMGEKPLLNALNGSATTSNESGTEGQGIEAMEKQLAELPDLEGAILQSRITPVQAYGAYTEAIGDEPRLFLDEADTETNATAAGQALGLIAAVSAQESLSQEDALLAGMLAAPKSTTAQQRTVFAQARAAFDIAAATRAGDIQDTDFLLSTANQKIYDAPQASTVQLQQQLQTIETAVETGTPIDKLGLTAPQWETMTGELLAAQYQGGINDANAQVAVDSQLRNSAWVKFYVVSGIALAALLLTILFTAVVGRRTIRRLRGLEKTALMLAEQQLPDVIGRLRRGDDVDIATEAPPLRIGDDEIGRVGQAFDLVRQTAIRSAVEEAKLRRGLNDVFRSLARRSQSLLHRQLTLLDQMERRASDPEALDDLFRLDHLTTRMRRHAEGLVILAGAPPGRGWSSPVRMVDVMRGAIAEVEDYARVSVATRSQAALSGSAVADVIHLLAELIENATTLSPPYTSVRVSGDTVGSGFAIEVEDRGLGMSAQRISELNDRLANPPEFNPSDSEQLGLFVVGQLARRHGIKVTLKSSPYGGTEAVVLIPRHLVVTEEAFRTSLPGDHAAAITMGPAAPVVNGHADSGPDVLEGRPTTRPLPFDAPSQLLDEPGFSGGPRIAGPLRRSQGSFPEGTPRGGHHAPPRVTNGNGFTGENGNGFAAAAGQDELDGGELPRRTRSGSSRSGPGSGPGSGSGSVTGSRAGQAGGAFDVFSPARHDDVDRPEPRSGLDTPRTTAPYADSFSEQPPAFPAWPGQGGPPGPPVQGGPLVQGGPATSPAPAPFTSSGSVTESRPPWELADDTGPEDIGTGAIGTGAIGTETAATAETGRELADGMGQSDGEFKGLPRRVKQASIAPQLRGDSGRRRRTTPADADASAGPTPEEIRATMSALQRGLQEGRSQRPGGGEPPWGQNPEGD